MTAAGMPDWRNAAHYAPLIDAGRPAFAWEWLRRSTKYRDSADGALHRARATCPDTPGATSFGLHRFEDPAKAIPFARPVWTADRFAGVLRARGEPAQGGKDALDLAWLSPLLTEVADASGRRLLLSDGYKSIRLDVSGTRPQDTCIRLEFRLTGLSELDRPLMLLQQLRSLTLTGRFARTIYPPAARATRLIQLLRAADALREGANHADLASLILGARLPPRGWRDQSPSLRSRAQRLATAAARMAAGGFWHLLH